MKYGTPRIRAATHFARWVSLPTCAVVAYSGVAVIGKAIGAEGSALIAPVAVPAGKVSMSAIWDTTQKGTRVAPQLRNAYEADYRDWPASLYATFDTPLGRAACTAALIGPKVMLTAAHCVPASRIVRFQFKKDEPNPPRVTVCDQHTDYRKDPSADFALCLLEEPFTTPTDDFAFDSVDLGAMAGRLRSTIVLTGFGCTSDIPNMPSTDGKYRYGFNTIVETSESPSGGRTRDPEFYSGSQNNNLLTGYDPADTQMANLCPGDSGGPAYRLTSNSNNLQSRLIVGVNSRVFYTDQTRTRYGASLISSTGTPKFVEWATEWLQQNNVQACGISSPTTIRNCRL